MSERVHWRNEMCLLVAEIVAASEHDAKKVLIHSAEMLSWVLRLLLLCKERGIFLQNAGLVCWHRLYSSGWHMRSNLPRLSWQAE